MPVHILAPWWRSAWAMAGYAVLAIGLLWALWQARAARRAHRANLLAQIREREDRLKLSLWGAGDSFWDWDVRNDVIHRIGAEHLLQGPAEQMLTTDEWREHATIRTTCRVHQRMQEHLAGLSESFESGTACAIPTTNGSGCARQGGRRCRLQSAARGRHRARHLRRAERERASPAGCAA